MQPDHQVSVSESDSRKGRRLDLAAALARRASAFSRQEDGALLAWNLTMILGMTMAVGLGISTQVQENNRAKLQNTLDRAVLAATDLDQTLGAKEVIADYVKRAGLEGALKDSNVQQGINFRTSSAEAEYGMSTMFVPGNPQWTVSAESAAIETITDVEISLVLDISGSMRFDDRITPLREAAKNFINMTLEGDRVLGTTISIVPYAGQVNPGPALFTALGGTRDHNHSSCLFMENEDFDHTELPKHSSRQVPHFMKWPIAWDYMDWGWCPSDFMRIRPMSNDAVELTTFIDAMRQHDGTGTQYGMKYALALLDPESETKLDTIETTLPTIARDRPLAWDAPNSGKFIVLMTDGKITDQFEPKHLVHRDIDDDDEDNENNDRDDVDGVDHALLNALVETNNQPNFGKDKKVVNRSKNLENFYKICDKAKAKEHGVIVFTIAFEAPPDASTEMRNCASTPTHFYEVDQLEIGAAFSSIAHQINQLRLTH